MTPGNPMDATPPFSTRQLPAEHDEFAPDTAEIRVMAATSRGSMAHGTLPAGRVSLALVHRTVDEIWYVTEGRGQVWRKYGRHEAVVEVEPGTALTIPLGTHFQFRAGETEALRFVMCTMPPWPGDAEAVRVPDHWPVDTNDGDARVDAAPGSPDLVPRATR